MSGNLNKTDYEQIKIFKETYNLPVIGGNSFHSLQDNIQQRQAIIKTGKRQERVFLWIKNPKEVTFEERFTELDHLVNDYNGLVSFLKTHQQAYQSFFVSLTDELKEVVTEKLIQVSADEQKRQQLEQKLISKNSNAKLLDEVKNLKTENYQNLCKFGNAFLLMLQKVEVISKGIDKLVNDQDAQKKILAQMVDDLSDYKEVYHLKKDIAKTRVEAEKLTQKALNLEKILKPVFGEFQGLIDQIVTIDSELNSTVSQIQDLVQNITNEQGLFTFEGDNQLTNNLVDFLVINEQKKAVLTDALNHAETKTTDFLLNNYQLLDECVEIEEAIANIQEKVTQQLTQMSGNFSQVIDVKVKPVSSSRDTLILGFQNNKFTNYTEKLPGGVKLEMIAIPAGSFMMGSSDAEIEKLIKKYDNDWFKNEAPQHKVTLKEFYLGKYPITQAQYQAIMGKNPSSFKDSKKAPLTKGGWGDHPVERVSWNEAQEFCKKLSKETGKEYRLPSEAQWEYACRARSKGKWCFGDDESLLKDYAWYRNNSKDQTHPVGEKKPNEWGIYDMHGNVWEWCEDDYVDNYNNAPNNELSYIAQKRSAKVLRGGSWNYFPHHCRCANRYDPSRADYYNRFGFRVMYDFGRTS